MPSSTTGTAIVGISVARKFCRNRYITRNTSTIASNSVFTTSSMEMRTNGVVSIGIDDLQTRRERTAPARPAVRVIALAVSSAFAPGASLMARPAAGLPLYLVLDRVVFGAELDARHVAAAAPASRRG